MRRAGRGRARATAAPRSSTPAPRRRSAPAASRRASPAPPPPERRPATGAALRRPHRPPAKTPPPLAERLPQLLRRRPAGPPREARARHVAEVGSAELQHDPARLEALGETLDRLIFEVFLRERAHALGRVDQQAARFIAVGHATALCRRFHLSRLTIRVLELRRCNDWAQLQDRVTGPLNRSVSGEYRLAARPQSRGRPLPDSFTPA